MKKIQQELFHRTQTSKDFLFYKTDEKHPEAISALLPDIALSIKEKFPATLYGKFFLDHLKPILSDQEKFGVLAIKLDDQPQFHNKPATEDLIMVLECIKALTDQENGVWGQLEPYLFISALPDKNADSLQLAVELFQKQLLDKTPQTVTIGMAAYPVLEYEKQDIIECALKALDHAGFFGPNSRVIFDAVSLNISGDHFYQKGDIEGAISEYKNALKIDPEDVNVLNSMGVCYAVMGNFDAAFGYFEAAAKYDPDEVMAWYNTALVYKLKGEKNKALNFFLKAGAKKTDSFEIAFQTGKIYFELDDDKIGRKYYKRALELAPETDGNHRFVGDCYTALGNIEKAKKAYQKAIKETPNDAFALSALGMLYDLKDENPDIALVFCQQSVDISPQNSLFRRRLALLYLKQKKWDKALDAFKKADYLDEASEKNKTQIKNTQKNELKRKRSLAKPSEKVKSVA